MEWGQFSTPIGVSVHADSQSAHKRHTLRWAFTSRLSPRQGGQGNKRSDVPLSPLESCRRSVITFLQEDEGKVRRLFVHVLAERGYKVVEAAHAEEALDLFARHQGGIDLLCTDLVMPGISGRELAERIRLRQPDLRVVYMSGYNTDALLGMGMLAPGGSYLQKPLRPAALAAEVRGALDRPLPSAAGGLVCG